MRPAIYLSLIWSGHTLIVQALDGDQDAARLSQPLGEHLALDGLVTHSTKLSELVKNGDDSKRDVASNPCSGTFAKPSYKVSGFQFNETSLGAPPKKVALTAFQLLDTANGDSFVCSAPYLEDPDLGEWYDCSSLGDASGPETVFRHQKSSKTLDVNQMWVCEQADKSYPRMFFSTATLNYADSLKCDNSDNSGTTTHCTILDDQAIAFSGEYTTPNSGPSKPEPVEQGPITSNIAKAPPSNDTPCVNMSFTSPSWAVQNFAYVSGAGGRVQFDLKNQATNRTVPCWWHQDVSGEAVWISCDGSTSVLFQEPENLLRVNQTWQCSAENYDDVVFKAFGNATLSPSCQTNGTCTAANTIVKGTLIEPIQLTPNAGPSGSIYPGCAKSSDAPSWEISSLTWHQWFRGNRNIGDMTALFRNNANGVTVLCEVLTAEELNELSDDHERWWGCGYYYQQFKGYELNSMVKLNPVTRQFSIRQTWWCKGDGDIPPAKYTAEGTVDVPFSCTWNNMTTTPQISGTPCPLSNTTGWNCTETCLVGTSSSTSNPSSTASTVHVPGTLTNKTTLSPTVFDNLQPSGYSCTIASVLAPKWRISWSSRTQYTDASRRGPNSTTTTVSVPIEPNLLTGVFISTRTGVELTPDYGAGAGNEEWHDCLDDDDRNSGGRRTTLECKWRIDLRTGYLALKYAWWCDDKNEASPIVFRAEAARYFNVSCYVDRPVKAITCTGNDARPLLPTRFEWDTSPSLDLSASP